jgi:outer membrane protein assembly factor BamA
VLGGSLEFAGLGGFSQFLRAESRGSWFFKPPGWSPSWFPWRDKSSFVLSARAGYALPFNDVSDFDFETASLPDLFPETKSLDHIDEDITLPLTQRYFLGGIGSYQLRGFKARSVGPRRAILYRGGFSGGGDAFTPVGRQPITGICDDTPDTPETPGFQGNGNGKCNSLSDEVDDDFDDLDETDVIGGNQFFSTSAEYRFPIAESLGLMGIVFFDAGNAFDENHTLFDVSLWRYGTGFGVQWFSPFGPLQAFLGFPIDRLEVEDTTVFEFSVGGAAF